ncbi:S-locus lectin protein kinase family protein [Rhynchospora pubera]|uniref:non-specific serine/threonine protein kinase n=1 Tax=Rhynchospora pubera TaxID=906938 RepID=A0AAV8HTC0_9POAL|nr:S-locus lectin protein kinase family protein [Rhynchospora pubera]
MTITEKKGSQLSYAFFVFYTLAIQAFIHLAAGALIETTEIRKGFSATPGHVNSEFQYLLADPTGLFAFGFMRVGPTKLNLAVVHLPSSLPVWSAIPSNLANWGRSTTLSFDGNLVLTDKSIHDGVLWSSNSTGGNFLVLRNTSNLQILFSSDENSAVWQSFDHPSDTLVQGQNFTSMVSLTTPDRRYALRIVGIHIGLFMEFGGRHEINYWRHSPFGAKGAIIYGIVQPLGFFGFYNADSSKAELLPFDSFDRGYLGLHRVTIQNDGNLHAYFWDNKKWDLVYTAVTEPCGLPGICGAYGLCLPGKPSCFCLVNGTDGCLQTDSGDFCSREYSDFSVVRRSGVTVEYNELMLSARVQSLAECEKICERNCTCWGALYAKTTNVCYLMDYPIQTVEASGDTHQGYFKVRQQGGGGSAERHRAATAVSVIFTLVFAGFALYGGYWCWDKRRSNLLRLQLAGSSQEMTQTPFKDLRSMNT